MINLTQDQFKWAAQITDVLGGFQNFFRRNVQHDYIVSMANRLAVWGFRGFEVDEAVRTLLDRDDERFPTANQVRDIARANKSASVSNSDRDPQIDQDMARYKKHRAQFEKALGEELLEKYIDFWHKEYFKGSEGLGIFAQNLRNVAFDQLAIADLARANGNAKRAIQLVRAEKEKYQNQTNGEIHEDDVYKVFRSKSVKTASFTIKQRA